MNGCGGRETKDGCLESWLESWNGCMRRTGAKGWVSGIQKDGCLESTAQMAMLQPYQRIIGLGMPVVPLILEELNREPNQWFWALEAITGQNPVPPEALGKVRNDGTGVD